MALVIDSGVIYSSLDRNDTDHLACRQLLEKTSEIRVVPEPVLVEVVDAAVVSIAERLGEDKVATLDRRHFGIIRPRHIDSFRLLPE